MDFGGGGGAAAAAAADSSPLSASAPGSDPAQTATAQTIDANRPAGDDSSWNSEPADETPWDGDLDWSWPNGSETDDRSSFSFSPSHSLAESSGYDSEESAGGDQAPSWFAAAQPASLTSESSEPASDGSGIPTGRPAALMPESEAGAGSGLIANSASESGSSSEASLNPASAWMPESDAEGYGYGGYHDSASGNPSDSESAQWQYDWLPADESEGTLTSEPGEMASAAPASPSSSPAGRPESRIIQRATVETVTEWEDIERLLLCDTCELETRPARLKVNRGFFLECPKTSRRKIQTKGEKDAWFNSGGVAGATSWPSEGPGRVLLKYGKVRRVDGVTLRCYEYTLIEREGVQQSEESLKRTLFQVFPSTTRTHRHNQKFAQALASAATSDSGAASAASPAATSRSRGSGEVNLTDVIGSVDAEGGGALTAARVLGLLGSGDPLGGVRPSRLTDADFQGVGPLVYREDRIVRRSRNDTDRWKNTGGKFSKRVLRVRDGNQQVLPGCIIHRRGKVTRHSTNAESQIVHRYDQFSVADIDARGKTDESGQGCIFHVEKTAEFAAAAAAAAGGKARSRASSGASGFDAEGAPPKRLKQEKRVAGAVALAACLVVVAFLNGFGSGQQQLPSLPSPSQLQDCIFGDSSNDHPAWLSQSTVGYLNRRCCGAVPESSCGMESERSGELLLLQGKAAVPARSSCSFTSGTTESDDARLWNQLDSNSVYIDVDTSDSNFDFLPHYIPVLRQNPSSAGRQRHQQHQQQHQQQLFTTAITRVAPTGFRFVVHGLEPLPVQLASSTFQVDWVAESAVCSRAGSSADTGSTRWQLFSKHTLHGFVPFPPEARFGSNDPVVVASLSCNDRCWLTTGGSTIYNLSNDGFEVFVFAPEIDFQAMDFLAFEGWGWQIDWLGTEDSRTGGQHDLIETPRFASTPFELAVDTGDAGHVTTPVFVFSPVSALKNPGTAECPAKSFLGTCSTPRFPTSIISSRGLGESWSQQQQAFSDAKCGTPAGFEGDEDTCGSYELSLGHISSGGSDQEVQVTLNCTYTSNIADRECPGIDTTFVSPSVHARSAQGFSASVATYHPNTSTAPWQREDLPMVDRQQLSDTPNIFSIKWIGVESHCKPTPADHGTMPRFGTWCERQFSTPLYEQCGDFLPVLARWHTPLTCPTPVDGDSDPTAPASTPETTHGGEPEPAADGSSCADILRRNPSAANGTYMIRVDGAESNRTFPVYCDMDTDDGGWTLVYKVSGSSAMVSNSSVNRDALAGQAGQLGSPGWGKLDDVAIRSLCTGQYRVQQVGGGDNTPRGLYCAFRDVNQYCDSCRNTEKSCATTYNARSMYPYAQDAFDRRLSHGFSTWGVLPGATVLQLAFDEVGLMGADSAPGTCPDTLYCDERTECCKRMIDLGITCENDFAPGAGRSAGKCDTTCGYSGGDCSSGAAQSAAPETISLDWKSTGHRGSPACYQCCRTGAENDGSMYHTAGTLSVHFSPTESEQGGAAGGTFWKRVWDNGLFGSVTDAVDPHRAFGTTRQAVMALRNSSEIGLPACADATASETCSTNGGCSAQVWCREDSGGPV